MAVFSHDPALVPNKSENITVIPAAVKFDKGLTDNQVTVTLLPASKYIYGTNLIDLVVADEGSSVTNTVTLEIKHQYQPPFITGLKGSYSVAAASDDGANHIQRQQSGRRLSERPGRHGQFRQHIACAEWQHRAGNDCRRLGSHDYLGPVGHGQRNRHHHP
jgi:hypothetical protein